jgi:lipopolysaccharide export LptBFGC system permease protein LptF
MPKRILVPVLITTGFFALTATNFILNPLITRADSNSQSTNLKLINKDEKVGVEEKNTTKYGGGQGYFSGKRVRSNDLALAKKLDVDTTKVEKAQSNLKQAEKDLKTEFESIRDQVRQALIKKAEDKKVDPKIIEDYKYSVRKWEKDTKSMTDLKADPESKNRDLKETEANIKEDQQNMDDAELALQDEVSK